MRGNHTTQISHMRKGERPSALEASRASFGLLICLFFNSLFRYSLRLSVSFYNEAGRLSSVLDVTLGFHFIIHTIYAFMLCVWAVCFVSRRSGTRAESQRIVPAPSTITGIQSSNECTPTELGSGLIAPRKMNATKARIENMARMLIPIRAPLEGITVCGSVSDRWKNCMLSSNRATSGRTCRMSAKMPNEYETGCTKFPQIQHHPAAINTIAATCRFKIEYCVFVVIVNTAFLCFHEYRFIFIFLNS